MSRNRFFSKNLSKQFMIIFASIALNVNKFYKKLQQFSLQSLENCEVNSNFRRKIGHHFELQRHLEVTILWDFLSNFPHNPHKYPIHCLYIHIEVNSNHTKKIVVYAVAFSLIFIPLPTSSVYFSDNLFY